MAVAQLADAPSCRVGRCGCVLSALLRTGSLLPPYGSWYYCNVTTICKKVVSEVAGKGLHISRLKHACYAYQFLKHCMILRHIAADWESKSSIQAARLHKAEDQAPKTSFSQPIKRGRYQRGRPTAITTHSPVPNDNRLDNDSLAMESKYMSSHALST
ncbi:hypothetical protein An11g07500 [Aspergillus niger]|uniref:Uncharacterized protein n=2 Tax=Aspergillus niger TaxID=5061 RepID=A2QX38_ASPNC|nr:hypothetical protein An11g07500 [Aspergillus niger]CAK40794.1 hypothetical protein An11g07500 [Aspergillus niger]